MSLINLLFVKCQVCGKKLRKNNSNQVLKYCSKECRKKRRDKNV